MQTKLFTILCVGFLLIADIQSEFVFNNDHKLVFMENTGKVAMVALNQSYFGFEKSGDTVRMRFECDKTGVFFAKKDGNNNYTTVEDGDAVRFVTAGSTFNMGEKDVPNSGTFNDPRDLFNAEGDNSALFDFMRLVRVESLDMHILEVPRMLYSNNQFFETTIQNKYGGSKDVLKDPENKLADNVFDPSNGEEAAKELIHLTIENFIKVSYMSNLAKESEDNQEVTKDVINDANETFLGALDMSGYTPKLGRNSFMGKFNDMVEKGSSLNMLIEAILFRRECGLEGGINLPIAVDGGHTQEKEDARMKSTKDLLFFELFRRLSDPSDSSSRDSAQEGKNQPILVGIRDDVKRWVLEKDILIDSAHSRLEKFFNYYISAQQAELMYWMILFKDQIDTYIDNYVATVNESSDFDKLFITNQALDYGKLTTVLYYMNPDRAYKGASKYNLIVSARRRNLVLV